MADPDKTLLMSLHKRRLPVDPPPGGLAALLARDKSTDKGPGATLKDHGREEDRRTMVRNLLNDRERAFAQKRAEYNERTRKFQEERQRLMCMQKKLVSSTLPPSIAGNLSDAHLVPSHTTRWRDLSCSVPQDPRSMVEEIKRNLTTTEAKIQQLREAHYRTVEQRSKPYNGEYGPQSYEAWQMKDYFMVRGIVDEMVDHILNKYIKAFPPVRGDAQPRLPPEVLERRARQLQSYVQEGRLIQLIMEDLLLQETYNLTELTAQELYSLWQMIRSKSNRELMKLAEIIATGQEEGRDPDDPIYSLVTKAFFNIQQQRNKLRPGVWAHSQPTNMQGASSEQEDSDVFLLEFDHITPMRYRSKTAVPGTDLKDQITALNWADYMDSEGLFWKGMSAKYFTITLGKKCKGATIVRPSPNHQLLAIGTVHGDILVYNLMMTPWQPLRVMHNYQKNSDDPLLDLNWSMSASHLISINLSGVLQVWRTHGKRGQTITDSKRLELTADQRGVWPEQLAQLLLLDGQRHDLHIQKGPLAGAEVHDRNIKLLPDLAAFCPTFTLLGSQTSLAVALSNGDLLRLDLENVLRENSEQVLSDADLERPETVPNSNNNANTSRPATRPATQATKEQTPLVQYAMEGRPNLRDGISQGVAAGLFRQHRSPLIYLGFVDQVGDMITVDEKGYIFLWPFNQESFTTYGWFKPRKKFRISGGRVTYQAAESGEQNIIFTHQRKDLTRKEIGVERTRVEELLKNLQLKDIWDKKYSRETGLITTIYLPKEGVSAGSGAMFHVIERHHQSKYLYVYARRLYQPHKVKSSKLLGVKMTPSGRELVIALLFPEYPPKVPTITLMVLDLHTHRLKDFLTNIDLTPAEYQTCFKDSAVSFDMSRPLGPSGTSYVFLSYCNNLVAMSIVTGSVVAKIKNPRTSEADYPGLLFSAKREITMMSGTEVTVVCTRGRIYLVLYYCGEDKRMHQLIQVVEIIDACKPEVRQNMRQAALKWLKEGARYGRDERVDQSGYSLGSEDHTACWMLELVLECMDTAIEESHGQPFTDQQYEAFDESDKIFMYNYVYKHICPPTL